MAWQFWRLAQNMRDEKREDDSVLLDRYILNECKITGKGPNFVDEADDVNQSWLGSHRCCNGRAELLKLAEEG